VFHWSRYVLFDANIVFSRLEYFPSKIDRPLVVKRKWTDRHASHATDILDHCRRYTFGEHEMPFANKRADDARGVEAARVVDHDRRFANSTHVIERGGERLAAGLLTENDFDEHHAIDRREEVDTDEPCRVLKLGSERRDRQGRRVGPENRIVTDHCLNFFNHVGFYLAIFEHGLDDEIAILQCSVV